jgi:hypothetical protein
MRVSRREFVAGAGIAALGLAAGCGRLPWQTREPDRLPRIAWLTGSSEPLRNFEAFQDGLRAYGYVPGQNITVESHSSEPADAESLRSIVAALVRPPVDLIVVGRVLPAALAG